MDTQEKQALQSVHKQLVQDLDPDPIMDHLFSKNIINDEIFDRLRLLDTRECVRKLMAILPRRGKDAFVEFSSALLQCQPFLNEMLQNSYKEAAAAAALPDCDGSDLDGDIANHDGDTAPCGTGDDDEDIRGRDATDVSDRDTLANEKGQSCSSKDHQNASTSMADEDGGDLWERGLLGTTSPQSLISTILWNNATRFDISNSKEHHALRWGDITHKKDENGKEFLLYQRLETKADTRQADNPEDGSKIIWSTSRSGLQKDPQDPVEVYKVFSSKRPHSMMQDQAPFYLGINRNKAKVWFKATRMGVNTLKSLMNKISMEARKLEIPTYRKVSWSTTDAGQFGQSQKFHVPPLGIGRPDFVGAAPKQPGAELQVLPGANITGGNITVNVTVVNLLPNSPTPKKRRVQASVPVNSTDCSD